MKSIELTKEYLIDQYIINKKGATKIANEFGCSVATVYRKLRCFDIKIRSHSEAASISMIGNRRAVGQIFTEERRTAMGDASRKRWSDPVYKNRLRNVRLGYRHSDEMKLRFSEKRRGPGNPHWMGGKSFSPYCIKFDDEFKEHIRDKFGRKCYICSKGEEENGMRLSVHHIDYNKNSICNGKEWAFVPLCMSHHCQSNYNRCHWFNLLINYWALNPEILFNPFVVIDIDKTPLVSTYGLSGHEGQP